jgi:chromosome segregation ATPase
MGRFLGWISVAMLAAAPLLVQAQGSLTYRCAGPDGKKYYGSAMPMQCAGRLVEVLNDRGMVVKRIDPVAEEKARAAKAEMAKNPEISAAVRDEERRNRALLATYTSVKDIEDARGRALRENATQAGRFEQRIKELQQRRARYEKELETYKKDGKGSSQTITDNIKNVELEIASQEELLNTKRGEIPSINAKYDEDKKRYTVATSGTAKK